MSIVSEIYTIVEQSNHLHEFGKIGLSVDLNTGNGGVTFFLKNGQFISQEISNWGYDNTTNTDIWRFERLSAIEIEKRKKAGEDISIIDCADCHAAKIDTSPRGGRACFIF